MKKPKHPHLGNLIRSKVEERQMSVAEFARQIHCERSTVYHIFSQESMDIARLWKISNVLNFDFIDEFNRKKTPNKTCIHQAKCMFFQR